MSKAKLVLGVRDLPRPRGEGFLYCKLHPGYHERILVNFNLYKTEEPELKEYFTEGIDRMLELPDVKKAGGLGLLDDYATENLQDWSAKVLAEVVEAAQKANQ